MSSGGPQHDRDTNQTAVLSSLLQTSISPSPSLLPSSTSLNNNQERQAYETEVKRLREKNSGLEGLVDRLGKELREWQIRYGSGDIKIDEVVGSEGNSKAPEWMTSTSIITPLMNAYDTRIAELTSVTEKQRRELDAFIEHSEQLVAENELLRENQLKDVKQLFAGGENDSNVGNGVMSGGAGAGFVSSDGVSMADVNERINLLMEENGLISEQNAILTKELENAHSEIYAREQNIINLSNSMTDAAMSMKAMEEKGERLEAEKATAEGEVVDKNNELNSLQETVNKQKEGMKDLGALKNVLLVQIADLKGERAQREAECDDLSSKVATSMTRINEISGKLSASTIRADGLSEKYRRTAAELAATRKDAEGMMTVMNGMEKQLSEFAAREEGVSQLSRECKTKVEDALLARDQGAAVCASLRREVAKLIEERKNLVNKKARGTEEVIEAIKSKMQAVIDQKDRDLHEMNVLNAKLVGSYERAKREKMQSEETYRKLKEVLNGEQGGLKEKFSDCTRRISEAESRWETGESQRKQLESQVRDLQGAIESKDATLADLRSRIDRMNDAEGAELNASKSAHRQAADMLEQKKFEVEKLKLQVEEAKGTASHKINEQVKKLQGEVEDANLLVESARSYAREKETLLQEQIEANGRMVDKVRAEKDTLVRQLEGKLTEERQVNQRLSARNQELGGRINLLAAEKSELHLIAVEHENKAEEADSEKKQLEATIDELAEQVQGHVAELQIRIKEESKLKSELKRLELLIQRR